MKKNILFIAFFVLSLSLFSQEKLKGNKIVVKEEREVSFFNKILVKDNINVLLSAGELPQVEVETDENLQEYIVTRVQDDVLEIYINQKISYSKKMLVYVKVSDTNLSIETQDKASVDANNQLNLDQIDLISSDRSKQNINANTKIANIISKDFSNIELVLNASEKMNISTEQNGNVKGNFKTNLFVLNLYNNSTIKAIGNCKTIEVMAQGNGNFLGKDMLADDIKISAFDKSDVAVNASKLVNISVENDAEIYIYDNPEILIKKFADKATLFKK